MPVACSDVKDVFNYILVKFESVTWVKSPESDLWNFAQQVVVVVFFLAIPSKYSPNSKKWTNLRKKNEETLKILWLKWKKWCSIGPEHE